MRTSKLTRTLVASAVLVALTGGYVAGRQHWQAPLASEMVADANAANPATPAANAPNTPNTAPRMLVPDFSQLAEQYGPAVVNISVTHDGKPSAGGGATAMPMPPGMIRTIRCSSSSVTFTARRATTAATAVAMVAAHRRAVSVRASS